MPEIAPWSGEADKPSTPERATIGIVEHLRLRKLDRVAAVYAVGGWLLVQASAIALPAFSAPAWALRVFIALVLVGFPLTLAIAWTIAPHPVSSAEPAPTRRTTDIAILAGLVVVIAIFLGQAGQAFLESTTSNSRRAANLVSELPGIRRVAVLPFGVVGKNQDASSLAASLRDEIIGALSDSQVDTLSRFDETALQGRDTNGELARLGVGLVLNGAVRSDGKSLSVRVHLDDTIAHATLWSKEFSAPVQEADTLQARVAGRTAGVTRLAVSPAVNAVRSTPEVLAAALEDSDSGSLVLAQRIVAEAPHFAFGHVLLALALFQSDIGLSDEERERAVNKIANEAKVALSLDRTNGDAYVILSDATPFSSWRERETLLLQGLRVAPDDAYLHYEYSALLRQAGRILESVVQGRLAVEANPHDFDGRRQLALSLAVAGRKEEALRTVTDARRLAPELAVFILTQIDVESYNSDASADRLELWKDPAWRSAVDDPEIYDLWLNVIEAVIGHDAANKTAVARRLSEAAIKYGPRIGSDVPLTLTRLGDVDGAYVIAGEYSVAHNLRSPAFFDTFDTTGLFAPSNALMRRDHRFMVLMNKVGLADYWRTSGHWPDFCSSL